ncbi:hyalin-like [Ptychodera flava]|uniref:hyalin-like n=1 Tax=Ptychodera flava TaxID=63121 RepID=UPI00396A7083
MLRSLLAVIFLYTWCASAENCTLPGNPLLGDNPILSSNETTFVENDILTFSCPINQTPSGPSRIVCTSSGDWSPPVNFQSGCLDPCENPGDISNGFQIRAGNYTSFSAVSYGCNSGFTLFPSEFSTTCVDGVWDFTNLPQCLADCSDLGQLSNGSRSPEPTNGSYPHDTILSFGCTNGYVMVGSDEVTCEEGMWSTDWPTCKSPCSDPRPLHNGTVNGTDYEHFSRLTFACDTGFFLQGPDFVICNDGVWEEAIPTCQEENECQNDPCVHGSCTDLFNDFHCTCIPGYAGNTCDQNIDECNGTNSCEQLCTDTEGSYTCSCMSGFVLNLDGKTCYDDEAPTIVCPSDITVDTDQSQDTANVTWSAPLATDNSGDEPSVNSTHWPGSVFPIGRWQVKYNAVDSTGNEASCTFEVIVEDNEPPVITNCPENITANTDQGLSTTNVTWTVPTATDNSGDVPTINANHQSDSPFSAGSTVVKYTATDTSGNKAQCIFVIDVQDNEPPIFYNCPGNTTTSSDQGQAWANVSWTEPEASDNSGTTPQVVSTDDSGSYFPIGYTSVRYTATDGDGNQAECTFVVYVRDSEPPYFDDCPENITANTEQGSATVNVSWTAPSASDNSGENVSVTVSHQPGSFFPLGSMDVTYTAEDSYGNQAKCTFTVTVKDIEPPVFTNCPNDMTVDTSQGMNAAYVSWTPANATDNSGVTPYVSTTSQPGSTFPIGNTTVIYTAIDASDNQAECIFTITVLDSESPIFTNCSDNITTTTDQGQAWANVSWTEPEASDNSGVTPQVVSTYEPGSHFSIGYTSVTYTATDDDGNQAECTFVVHVQDLEPPWLSNCPVNITANTEEGSDKVNVSWTAPSASDNSGENVSVTVSHQPGSFFPLGSTDVSYSAEDSYGNQAFCSFKVTVKDDEPPVLTGCPNDTTVETGQGMNSANVSWTLPSATDNEGVAPTVRTTHQPMSSFPIGNTTVVYTATDGSENQAECIFIITVLDLEQPVFGSCPGDITAYTEQGSTSVNVSWTEPTVSDNSRENVSSVSSHRPGSSFQIGSMNVTYTATDPSGNQERCDFVVIVKDFVDTEPPVFTGCPNDTTVETDQGMDSANVAWTPPSATDNSGVATVNTTHQPMPFPIGNTTVVYTATDNSGNQAECTFTITVVDLEQPVFASCPTSVTVDAELGSDSVNVSWTEPSASDNSNGYVSLVASHQPGSFVLGSTSVTYTATDPYGNQANCDFVVIVQDNEKPEITNCPNDTIVNVAPGQSTASVTWAEPTATDNSGISPNLTSTYLPGFEFPAGETRVSYVATDNSGNQGTCAFVVTVAIPGNFTFTEQSYTFQEGINVISIPVHRIGGADGDVSVDFGTQELLATSPEHFLSKSGTLLFPDQITVQDINITIVDDETVGEPNRFFLISLSNPSDGTFLVDPSTTFITIEDDDFTTTAGPTTTKSTSRPTTSMDIVTARTTRIETSQVSDTNTRGPASTPIHPSTPLLTPTGITASTSSSESTIDNTLSVTGGRDTTIPATTERTADVTTRFATADRSTTPAAGQGTSRMTTMDRTAAATARLATPDRTTTMIAGESSTNVATTDRASAGTTRLATSDTTATVPFSQRTTRPSSIDRTLAGTTRVTTSDTTATATTSEGTATVPSSQRTTRPSSTDRTSAGTARVTTSDTTATVPSSQRSTRSSSTDRTSAGTARVTTSDTTATVPSSQRTTRSSSTDRTSAGTTRVTTSDTTATVPSSQRTTSRQAQKERQLVLPE